MRLLLLFMDPDIFTVIRSYQR